MDILVIIAWATILTAIFTLVTTLIQCLEMWILIQNQRETNRLLSNPGELLLKGLHGMADELKDNPEAQAAIFEFVGACGAVAYNTALQAVKGKIADTIKKEIPVPRKYRWLYEIGNNFLGNKSSQPGESSNTKELAPL